jgi:hypothetical protein
MGCFAKKLTELVFPANTFTQYHHQLKRLFDDIYGYDNIKSYSLTYYGLYNMINVI